MYIPRGHCHCRTRQWQIRFFEGIRAYETARGGAIFRLQEHIDRFFDNAKMINKPMPCTKEVLREAILAVIKANNLTTAYIRPLAYLGTEKWGAVMEGLSLHVAVAAFAGGYRNNDACKQGLSTMTSSYQRNHVN